MTAVGDERHGRSRVADRAQPLAQLVVGDHAGDLAAVAVPPRHVGGQEHLVEAVGLVPGHVGHPRAVAAEEHERLVARPHPPGEPDQLAEDAPPRRVRVGVGVAPPGEDGHVRRIGPLPDQQVPPQRRVVRGPLQPHAAPVDLVAERTPEERVLPARDEEGVSPGRGGRAGPHAADARDEEERREHGGPAAGHAARAARPPWRRPPRRGRGTGAPHAIRRARAASTGASATPSPRCRDAARRARGG